jgi:hypothetical protein
VSADSLAVFSVAISDFLSEISVFRLAVKVSSADFLVVASAVILLSTYVSVARPVIIELKGTSVVVPFLKVKVNVLVSLLKSIFTTDDSIGKSIIVDSEINLSFLSYNFACNSYVVLFISKSIL